jgi:signal transduction histidine kinase
VGDPKAHPEGGLRREDLIPHIRSAGHDLRNLIYRLTFLAESLGRDMPPSAARDDAVALLNETARSLGAIADRLRGLAAAGP